MKNQDLYNITLSAADTKASEQIQVGFLLIRNMGYGKQEIANEITDLRQAVRVMRAGMTDSESDRLESIRLERTGVEYDAEQGTIAEEFSETVGDLVDVLNMGDYQCSLSAKIGTRAVVSKDITKDQAAEILQKNPSLTQVDTPSGYYPRPK